MCGCVPLCLLFLASYLLNLQLIGILSCTKLTVCSDCGFDLITIFHMMEPHLVHLLLFISVSGGFALGLASLIFVIRWCCRASCLCLVSARKITATGELRGQNHADTPTKVVSTSSEQPPLYYLPMKI